MLDSAVQNLMLIGPLIVWMFLGLRKPDAWQLTASLFSFVWMLQSGLIVPVLFVQFGVGLFDLQGPKFYGVPVKLVIGQAMMAGPAIFLLFYKSRMVVKMLASAVVCLIYILLNHAEFSAIIFASSLGACIVPSVLLAEWTARQTHIYLRSILQGVMWAVCLFWLLPAIVLIQAGFSWLPIFEREWQTNIFYFLPMMIPMSILVAALYQFAIEGNGTAFPYDPPDRLVTKGIYAYLSNPMQLGICLGLFWWGFAIGTPLFSWTAPIAVVLFIAFKDVCNGSCAIGEQDPNWIIYQKNVRKWIPRKTPWRLSQGSH